MTSRDSSAVRPARFAKTVAGSEKKKRRKDYAFWRRFDEKPSIIPGCPAGRQCHCWRQAFLHAAPTSAVQANLRQEQL